MAKEGEGGVMQEEDRKTFLVAGGAGFLGRHLCRKILERGHKVICLDESLNSTFPDPYYTHYLRDVVVDCYVEEKLDFVLNFASMASPKDFLENPTKTLRTNAIGTHNLVLLALSRNARFLLASSGQIYGTNDPTEPRAVYVEAKRYAESLTTAYQEKKGLDARTVRMWNTYGPGMRIMDGRVIPEFIRRAHFGLPISVQGGNQAVSFTYVDDMIEGILKVLYSDEIRPVDLGNPHLVQIGPLAKRIIQMMGSPSELDIVPFHSREESPPSLHLARNLGWSPQVEIDEGLKRTIADVSRRIKVGADHDG